MATCPYNQNHCFAKYKLFPHLQRCKDAKRGRKLYQCKKDIMVMFFIEDKPSHYAICSYCSKSSKLSETKDSQLDRLRDKKVEIIKSNELLNSINFDLNITKDESLLDYNLNNELILDKSNFVEDFDIKAITEGSEDKSISKNETILY